MKTIYFIGIKHNHITCDGCHEDNIKGLRWKCAVCDDFDLCSSCYFKGKHDLKHNFSRISESFGERFVSQIFAKSQLVKWVLYA